VVTVEGRSSTHAFTTACRIGRLHMVDSSAYYAV